MSLLHPFMNYLSASESAYNQSEYPECLSLEFRTSFISIPVNEHKLLAYHTMILYDKAVPGVLSGTASLQCSQRWSLRCVAKTVSSQCAC